MYKRTLALPPSKSYFLFGPRQIGKSTIVRSLVKPEDMFIDLLPQETFLTYAKNPGRLRGEILAHLKRHKKFRCVLDEVQKLPSLLDDVHSLIESTPVTFSLTGSSARKLKRGASNLLAGRAIRYQLFPLTFQELGDDFELARALRVGTLPPVWQKDKDMPAEFLKTYAQTYLREEIQEEGLVRRLGPFSGFLDIAAASDGEIVNFSNVARECHVSVKTVQQYYQILEDTFLAVKLPAWSRGTREKLVSHPRYYFFDPGVANALTHQLAENLDPVTRGRRFEQFVVNQIRAALEYHRRDIELCFWRTHGGVEVDLVFARGAKIVAAAEIKSSARIAPTHASGLRAFLDRYPKTQCFLLFPGEREFLLNPAISAVPWDQFLKDQLLRL